jgi:hypothetical protein
MHTRVDIIDINDVIKSLVIPSGILYAIGVGTIAEHRATTATFK